MEATDHTIEINGLKLHYLEWGGTSKPTILLLHGFMGHAHVWDDLAAELALRYHVLALDQRGHGDSEWSAQASYGMDQHFTDLSVFIDSLGMEKFILLGHSMGGRNALFYTACRPEKVERLVLVDARIGKSRNANAALMRQMKSLPVRAGDIRDVEDALRDLYPYMPGEVRKHIAGYGYRKTEEGGLIPKYDARMSRQISESAEPMTDLWQMLCNVTCPVLFVRGQESPFVSEGEFRHMRDRFPAAVFREISGATHMPAQENPDLFKNILRVFLDGDKGGRKT